MSTPTTTPSLSMQDFFTTTLNGGIAAGDTTINLAAVPNNGEGFLVIDPNNATTREIIYFNSKTGSAVVCPSAALGRGQGSTTAASHSSGVAVQMNMNSQYWLELQNGHALGLGSVNPTNLVSGTGTAWAWQSWTPSFVNWTIGTGGSAGTTAKYCQIGKVVFYRIKSTLGSSGQSVGAAPTFTLPVTAHADYSLSFPMSIVRLSVAATGYSGYIYFSDTTHGQLIPVAATGSYTQDGAISSSVPNTWVAGDNFQAHGFYEAA